MKGSLNHIELHASKPDVTIPFYKEFLSYFEWRVVAEFGAGMGMSDGNVSLWIFRTDESQRHVPMNRDAAGLGHIGIKVGSQQDVDAFYNEYMKPKSIEAQFDTPRARADFGGSYYQVMFVDPEGLAVEVFTA